MIQYAFFHSEVFFHNVNIKVIKAIIAMHAQNTILCFSKLVMIVCFWRFRLIQSYVLRFAQYLYFSS